MDNTDFTWDEIYDDTDRLSEDIMIEEEYFRELDHLAKEIIESLKAVGFHILRYNAHSSNSIYLKLDYGVCNSIRISDHKGRKYLKYRYNLLSCIDHSYMEHDKYPRFYYPADEIRFLIDKIIFDRNTKIAQYGANKYAEYMESNRAQHMHDKQGFWSKSYRV